MLLQQDVEGAARGRRAHDLEADGACSGGGHELDVGQQPLGAGAEHDDRRLEGERRREVLDRERVRLYLESK